MNHTYFDQDDCRAIINGLPVKKLPQPEPKPSVRWKLMASIAAWATVLGLTFQWAIHGR